MEGAGFSRWSSPEQVFRSLRSPFELAWLLSRLKSAPAVLGYPPAQPERLTTAGLALGSAPHVGPPTGVE